MKKRLGFTGGGRGPWAQPKSGAIPSPASEMAQQASLHKKPGPINPPKRLPKQTRGISKRMVWGA